MSILYLSEQGSYLRKQGGRFVIMKKDEELASIPQAAVERVIVFGNCQISTQAVSELLDAGAAVIYLGRNGLFKGMLEPGYPKNIFVRLAQYERSLNPEYCADTAKALIEAKLRRCAVMHARWRRNLWLESSPSADDETLKQAREKLAACQNNEQIRAIEAGAAKVHFNLLAESLPPPFEWHGRNRQPPRDPVNALLSLAYMLTLSQVLSACYARGLDPFIGFLHALDYSRPSLALDLMEPLRPVCDHFVLHRLQRGDFEPSDFQYGEEQGCRLNTSAFRSFIELFQNLLENSRTEKQSPMNRTIDKIALEAASAFKEKRTPSFYEDI